MFKAKCRKWQMFGSAGEFKIGFHDENIPADEPWKYIKRINEKWK